MERDDTISRLAAIDVVKRLMGDYELSRTVQIGLQILPPAQPVLTCKGCKYDHYECVQCLNCLRKERDLYEPE